MSASVHALCLSKTSHVHSMETCSCSGCSQHDEQNMQALRSAVNSGS